MKTTLSKPRGMKSLATVSAALAATAASSQAATVQITLTGNQLTTSTNTLNADVTGDHINDITISDTFASVGAGGAWIRCNINGGRDKGVQAGYLTVDKFFFAEASFVFPGIGVSYGYGLSGFNIKYLNRITFTDARINGGVLTQGYLEVNAFNSSKTDHTIALTRLVFDNASTTLGPSGLSTSAIYTEFVPEPSSFAMLALGAGGLLARRRRPVA